ncbi:cytochrome c biogenesis CcdA family protein [Catellatospora bangladeshensis]|uniref:Cytochrome C biogenesis protein CcdA n=1 Tax=Catellatospora bangladeshensis TaxID=310355 RepID=A0A8J3JKV3_9ACTN|nr:cytochrome c biogenesis CcdA family protein [Catellatospora bangladeshensis]GIF82372.1 cytochrome C biogenesis protein CcdA [Catellatospora bangladeshensis]
MGTDFVAVVNGGPLVLAVAVATLAGLVSFLSPCVLPLVPGYLSYVTGLVGADLDATLGDDRSGLGRARRGRVLAGVLLFIAGFAAVFLTTTILVAQVGRVLLTHERVLQTVVGGLIVLFGLAFLGVVPGLDSERRIQKLPQAGLWGAPVFGAVFALSWMPCLSPTLGAVGSLALVYGDTGRAVVLGLAYCLGIGLPFLALGLGMRKLGGVVGFIRRNSRWVTRFGGALLIVVGLALITGGWNDFVIWLQVTFGVGSVAI